MNCFSGESGFLLINGTSLENILSDNLNYHFFNKRKMTLDEIKDYHRNLNPKWDDVFKLWRRSDISSINITRVGTYIGSIYLERILNEKIPKFY